MTIKHNFQSAVWLALMMVVLSAGADTLVFKTGHTVQGKVLQTNEASILFGRDFGTFNYPREHIKQIVIEKVIVEGSATTNRIPTWNKTVAMLAKQPWAIGTKQIPATVIDAGIFQNVPYSSFRAGASYEINVYGDPEQPAAIEIGVTGGAVKDAVAKGNCVEFMASVFSNPTDKETIQKLNRTEDVKGSDDLVFEVTPPTAIDAYGGWWISVYNEDKLNKARASFDELKLISESVVPMSGDASFNPNDAKWSNEEKKEARQIRYVVIPKVSPSTPPPSEKPSSYRAPEATSYRTPSYNPPSSSYSSGPVYVRGYYRKDGTYVHPHTRRR